MKASNTINLSEQYQAALRIHFAQGPEAGLHAAHDLGEQALVIGLETRDLGMMHEHALCALLLPEWDDFKKELLTNRAALFFNEAIKRMKVPPRDAPDGRRGPKQQAGSSRAGQRAGHYQLTSCTRVSGAQSMG